MVRLPSALLDLNLTAEYIQHQSGPDRAIRFLRSADATFTRLARMPGMGSRYDSNEPMSANLRYSPIDDHKNFLVFYRPISDGIEVFRVLHGARDIAGILALEVDPASDGDDATNESASP